MVAYYRRYGIVVIVNLFRPVARSYQPGAGSSDKAPDLQRVATRTAVSEYFDTRETSDVPAAFRECAVSTQGCREAIAFSVKILWSTDEGLACRRNSSDWG